MPQSSSPTLVHSEVINYIKDFRGSLSHNSRLMKCLEKAFDISHIEHAKDTLINLYSISEAPSRRGRGKVSKYEHLILDIIDMLASHHIPSEVVFYSTNLRCLLPCVSAVEIAIDFEHLTVAQGKVQESVEKLTETITIDKNEVIDNVKLLVNNCDKTVESMNHLVARVESLEKRIGMPPLPNPFQTNDMGRPFDCNTQKVDSAKSYSSALRQKSQYNQILSEGQDCGVNRFPPHSFGQKDYIQKDCEFEMQRHQRRSQMRKDRRDNKAIIGTNTDSSIKSSKQMDDLFVFRIHPDVESEQVRCNINRQVKVYAIEKVSHDDAPMQSFKVTINSDDFNTVMDAEFWPAGVRCRKFFRKTISFEHGSKQS